MWLNVPQEKLQIIFRFLVVEIVKNMLVFFILNEQKTALRCKNKHVN